MTTFFDVCLALLFYFAIPHVSWCRAIVRRTALGPQGVIEFVSLAMIYILWPLLLVMSVASFLSDIGRKQEL